MRIHFRNLQDKIKTMKVRKVMKTKQMIAMSVAASMLAGTGLLAAENMAKNPGQLSSSDYKFACEAAHGGLFEVQAGNLAATKATDPQVKQFAQQMVTDHRQADSQLTAIASREGATLPTSLTKSESEKLQKLQGLSGKDFDEAYVKDMVSDHKKDLSAFRDEAKDADSPEIKTFAASTATVIQNHLNMIKGIEKTTK